MRLTGADNARALEDFIGPDGLARLTALLSLGTVRSQAKTIKPANLDHWVELMRRVQLPYYEEARAALVNEGEQGDYNDADAAVPYLQENLQRLAREIRDISSTA